MSPIVPSPRGDQTDLSSKWNDLLYSSLRDASRPVFVFDDVTVPAASLWTGARIWTRAFRNAGLDSGDRLVIHLPPSPAFIQVLIAGIWDDLSLIITNPAKPPPANEFLDQFDACGGVSRHHRPGYWTASELSGPKQEPELRSTISHQSSQDIRLFLRTSGTSGSPDWYGLSDRNILTVLRSHQDVLENTKTALSYLPWHHCFGLILGLMNHLLSNKIVYRDSSGGRDIGRLKQLIDDHQPEFLNSVPVIAEKLGNQFGPEILSSFNEGIVGGAPLNASQCELLKRTELRVGYGQTEASPGITLGEQGQFRPNYLGEPVGCKLRATDDNELEFRGTNAVEMELDDDTGELTRNTCPRWTATGDLGQEKLDGWYFVGRKNQAFKLPNGTFAHPREFERSIRTLDPSIKNAFVDTQRSNPPTVFVGLSGDKNLPDSLENSIRQEMTYVHSIQTVAPETIIHNKKGEIDRPATRRAIDPS